MNAGRDKPPTLMELVERLRETEYQHGATAATYGDDDGATLAHKIDADEIAAEIDRRIGDLATEMVKAIGALADIAGLPGSGNG